MPATPVRGFPRSWGLFQLFLRPSLQVHGKVWMVSPISLRLQSGHSMTAFLFCSHHTVRDAGYSVACWFPWFSLSTKDSSPLPLDHILSQSSTPRSVPFSEVPNAQCHIQPSIFPSALPTSSIYRWSKWSPARWTHSPRPRSLLLLSTPGSLFTDLAVHSLNTCWIQNFHSLRIRHYHTLVREAEW